MRYVISLHPRIHGDNSDDAFPALLFPPEIHVNGRFKVADWFEPFIQDQNIILSSTFEYRFPPPEAVQKAAQNADKTAATENPETVKLNMTSRLIGLVVIPGQYITRIELEEIPEQARACELFMR